MRLSCRRDPPGSVWRYARKLCAVPCRSAYLLGASRLSSPPLLTNDKCGLASHLDFEYLVSCIELCPELGRGQRSPPVEQRWNTDVFLAKPAAPVCVRPLESLCRWHSCPSRVYRAGPWRLLWSIVHCQLPKYATITRPGVPSRASTKTAEWCLSVASGICAVATTHRPTATDGPPAEAVVEGDWCLSVSIPLGLHAGWWHKQGSNVVKPSHSRTCRSSRRRERIAIMSNQLEAASVRLYTLAKDPKGDQLTDNAAATATLNDGHTRLHER